MENGFPAGDKIIDDIAAVASPPSSLRTHYRAPPCAALVEQNCGLALNLGTVLIYATRSIWARLISSANSSGLRLEWPIVKKASHGALMSEFLEKERNDLHCIA